MMKKGMLLFVVLAGMLLLFLTGCATGGQSGEVEIDQNTGEIIGK